MVITEEGADKYSKCDGAVSFCQWTTDIFS